MNDIIHENRIKGEIEDFKKKIKSRKKIKIILVLLYVIICLLIHFRNDDIYKEDNESVLDIELVTTEENVADDSTKGDTNLIETQPAYYTITFQNEDGSLLQTITVKQGETPIYDEEAIALPKLFLHWDKELSPAFEDSTYTAIVHHHSYTSTVVEPTCFDKGYTLYRCDECGYEYIGNYIELLGHDYTPRIHEPTCTEIGETEYICYRCGSKYHDDKVPALGHDFTTIDRVENVEDTDKKISTNYNIYKCPRCAEEHIEFLDATYDYLEAVQIFTVPKDGIYQIEAYGAQGGGEGSNVGGTGGYVKGEVQLHEADTLYIVIGGKGANSSKTSVGVGGYNGGANGGNHKAGGYYYGAGGGGATSIIYAPKDATEEDKEKINKTLVQVGKTEFDKNGLIVAGGGGAKGHSSSTTNIAGGSIKTTDTFGQGTAGITSGKYQEGDGGGGGGYYGGTANVNRNNSVPSGAGGTSWSNTELTDPTIGLAPKIENVTKQAGVQPGNGKCIITFK